MWIIARMKEKQKELQKTMDKIKENKKTHKQKISELDYWLVYNLIKEKQLTMQDFKIWCEELENKYILEEINNQ